MCEEDESRYAFLKTNMEDGETGHQRRFKKANEELIKRAQVERDRQDEVDRELEKLASTGLVEPPKGFAERTSVRIVEEGDREDPE